MPLSSPSRARRHVAAATAVVLTSTLVASLSAVSAVGAAAASVPETSATSPATAGGDACTVVKRNTAKKFKKRTKVFKKTRKKRNMARKEFRAAKKPARVLKKRFVQARKKFRAAKRQRQVIVKRRAQVCKPSTRRVSVSSKGKAGNGRSYDPVISANDRFVAFTSEATNLVPGDTNRAADVFVHDRVNARTTRVSVTSSGKQVQWGGEAPAISADGRYVAFVSNSPDLGSAQGRNRGDVFVHDRTTRKTTKATYAANGTGNINHWPRNLSISDDGRYVAFDSFATNVVSGYTPTDMISAYVVDRVAKKNYHASVTSTGAPTNAWVEDVKISGNGRFVVYSTDASNYVPGRGQKWDHKVFMWDRTTGRSRIVSVNNDGTAMEMASRHPSVSADGRHVLFEKKKVTNWSPTSATVGPESLQLYDRLGTVGSYRKQVYGRAYGSSMSPDATHVAFQTGTYEGVVKNLRTGKELLVGGLKKQPAEGGWLESFSLSDGGRALAFSTEATNIVKKDGNGVEDVFVRRR